MKAHAVPREPREKTPLTPQRRIRRARTLAVLTLVAGLVGSIIVWNVTKPVGGAVAEHSIEMPSEGASAVRVSGAEAVLGADSSTLLDAQDADTRYPIASVTKVITALVVLEAHPLANLDDPGPAITYSETDAQRYDWYNEQGASVTPMPAGRIQSEFSAIATMLIPSASNYADVLATWAFGSTEAYVAAAQDWLQRNGLNDTTIVDPTGISAENSSTPRDLLKIGTLAAQNPVIAWITALKTFPLADGSEAKNTNTLLGVDGVTGLKTGNLGDGNYVLLYTASLDVGADAPLSVVGVSLGGESRESVASGVRTVLASIKTAYAARS